ncbi:fumarylacetoacetate hydrolase family protein [Achromobacter agilis]|uniref:Ureidoglycolate lyase n=1 Tax=Achromobacter agilis TaxID=1353888 RepID=A0A446C9D2_9BURK|nr:fumarylacetoacetate hydrolase family protein [Achromobacter agilis]SSW64434.1 Ureidoglycolate lyase [Achromobacter agilis]
MKLLSFERQGLASWGLLAEDGRIIDGQPLTQGRYRSLRAALQAQALPDIARAARGRAADVSLEDVQLLPVIPDPGKILCVGLNYEDHRRETNREPTGEPTLFLRVATSQVGHGLAIRCPAESHKLDYEGEIAVVIGKGGRRISQEDAYAHIAGYAPYNDASVRDWQQHTSQWTPGKNFDATGAFGPWMATRDEVPDGADLSLSTRLNGEVVQHATTAQLIFSIPRLIQYISRFATLEPGDVIVTGTPGGVGFKRNPPLFMKDGDIVEVEVGSVGCLSNRVLAG